MCITHFLFLNYFTSSTPYSMCYHTSLLLPGALYSTIVPVCRRVFWVYWLFYFVYSVCATSVLQSYLFVGAYSVTCTLFLNYKYHIEEGIVCIWHMHRAKSHRTQNSFMHACINVCHCYIVRSTTGHGISWRGYRYSNFLFVVSSLFRCNSSVQNLYFRFYVRFVRFFAKLHIWA